MKWATWWKRVQPAVKESPNFTVRDDGSTTLKGDPIQIPYAPLLSAPKTVRKKDTESTPSLAIKIVGGEIHLQDIPALDQQRRVFREVAKKNRWEWLDAEGFTEELVSSIPTARMVFDELARSGQFDRWTDQVNRYYRSITAGLSLSAGQADKRQDGKWITGRTDMIESVCATATGAPGFQGIDGGLIESLVDLWLEIAGRDNSDWSTTAQDHIEVSLALFLIEDQALTGSLAASFSRSKIPSAVKIRALDSFMRRFDSKQRLPVLREMWRAGLDPAREIGWRILTRTNPPDRLSEAVVQEIDHIMDSNDNRHLQVLADYSKRVSPESTGSELRIITLAQLKLAALSEEASKLLEDHLMTNLESVLAPISEVTSENNEPVTPDLIELFLSSASRVLDTEKAQLQITVGELQSRIRELEDSLQHTEQRNVQVEAMGDQLRRGFKLPEKWAEFQGQKMVLEEITKYYQELERAGTTGSLDRQSIDWITRRLDTALSQFRVTKIGTFGSHHDFDVSRHQLIPGEGDPGGGVIVESPGFVWVDPEGNEVVLVKSQVRSQ
jgi:molecular chaperone GrpE (heat shock protein)